MISQAHGQVLCLSDIPEISAITAPAFFQEVKAALDGSTTLLEIDLSNTRFVDSAGLGALFSVYRATEESGDVRLRLRNVTPEIRRLLELTQMDKFYEIVSH